MVSTLPSSPARKPGNPSPRSYHGLGRRRWEDIRAIRCGGSNCCGPKSTRRKTIELNRSCFYRTGLVAGWVATEPVLCRCATRHGLHPAPFPLRQPCAFFIFFCFPAKILYIGKFDDLTHPGHKARHTFAYIIYVCVYVYVCVCICFYLSLIHI